MIKDVLPSDLSEEQSCSTPCFDSFCVEEMKTQRVQRQEITSVAALKNCSSLLPLGTTADSLHRKVARTGLFPLNLVRFIKKALLFQCVVLLFKKHRNICTVSSGCLWFCWRCSWGSQTISFIFETKGWSWNFEKSYQMFYSYLCISPVVKAGPCRGLLNRSTSTILQNFFLKRQITSLQKFKNNFGRY